MIRVLTTNNLSHATIVPFVKTVFIQQRYILPFDQSLLPPFASVIIASGEELN
jgi:hypothetical protein